MAGGPNRRALIIVRLWADSASSNSFRARLSLVRDPELGEVEVALAGTPEEVVQLVAIFVRSFDGSNDPGSPRRFTPQIVDP